MNFYPHHIGDFNNATRHLTRIERSIYRDMIDLYYDTEGPLMLDVASLCRKLIARTDEESAAVEQVLNEFFTKTEQGWHHSRCESEINAYRASITAKSAAGKASAAKRERDRLEMLEKLNERSTGVQQPLESVNSSVEPTKNQEPVTNNQSLKDKAPEKSGSGVVAKTFDFSSWPTEPDPKVWAEYQKHRTKVKAGLSQVVVNRLGKEMHKAEEIGYTVDEFLTECMFRGWKGGEAGWLTAKNKASAHTGFAKQDYHKGVAADGSF